MDKSMKKGAIVGFSVSLVVGALSSFHWFCTPKLQLTAATWTGGHATYSQFRNGNCDILEEKKDRTMLKRYFDYKCDGTAEYIREETFYEGRRIRDLTMHKVKGNKDEFEVNIDPYYKTLKSIILDAQESEE